MQVNDLCSLNEPCARCAKDLQSDDTDCQMLIDAGCNAVLIDVDDTQRETIVVMYM